MNRTQAGSDITLRALIEINDQTLVLLGEDLQPLCVIVVSLLDPANFVPNPQYGFDIALMVIGTDSQDSLLGPRGF